MQTCFASVLGGRGLPRIREVRTVALVVIFVLSLAWVAPASVLAQSPAPPVAAGSRGQDGAAPAASIAMLIGDADALAGWLAQHSQDAAAAAARVEQARALIGASRLRPNPVVTQGFAGVPVGDTNPPGLGWGETVNYGTSVAQMVEIGKRGPRTAAARARMTSERANYADTLAGAMGDARAAMARVLYLQGRRASIQDDLATARQILDLQRIRLDRGDLSGLDFDRLQLDVQVLEADLARTAADVREAQATCARVLFAPCDATGADLDTLIGLLQPADAALPGDLETRLAARPDISALDAQREASAADILVARRRKVPDPVINFGFLRDRFVISGNNPRTLAFGVSVPIAVFDRGQFEIARAAAAGSELQATQAALVVRARTDAEALRDRQAAIASALATLRDGALARATGIFTTTSDAVNQGELSTTDLLLARRARTDIALKVMELQLELFLVQNELRQVLGTDTPILRRIEGLKWTTP